MPSGFTYLRKALKGSHGVGWRWVVRPVLKDDIYSARAFGGYANTGGFNGLTSWGGTLTIWTGLLQVRRAFQKCFNSIPQFGPYRK